MYFRNIFYEEVWLVYETHSSSTKPRGSNLRHPFFLKKGFTSKDIYLLAYDKEWAHELTEVTHTKSIEWQSKVFLKQR